MYAHARAHVHAYASAQIWSLALSLSLSLSLSHTHARSHSLSFSLSLTDRVETCSRPRRKQRRDAAVPSCCRCRLRSVSSTMMSDRPHDRGRTRCGSHARVCSVEPQSITPPGWSEKGVESMIRAARQYRIVSYRHSDTRTHSDTSRHRVHARVHSRVMLRSLAGRLS